MTALQAAVESSQTNLDTYSLKVTPLLTNFSVCPPPTLDYNLSGIVFQVLCRKFVLTSFLNICRPATCAHECSHQSQHCRRIHYLTKVHSSLYCALQLRISERHLLRLLNLIVKFIRSSYNLKAQTFLFYKATRRNL